MAAIKDANTKPELLVRKALHAAGFRYRLHVRGLPGQPDLVLPRFRAAIFVNGCFWHRHECHLFKWPATRADFWKAKLDRNVDNDRRVAEALLDAGWRVAVVWECALKGRTRLDASDAMKRLAGWIMSEDKRFTIRGE
jgi:DNA mismatch endonuclease (patch repair protein)